MMTVNNDFKTKVLAALAIDRENYGGSTAEFCNRWKINTSVYSRMKNGETDGVLKDATWLEIGRKLDVSLTKKVLNLVRTDVFETIQEDIEFCQEYSKSMIYVDDCEIGKTRAVKHFSLTLPNCFRIDASQSKDTLDFIKALAKEIGVKTDGKRSDIKNNIKYNLNNMNKPIVIIDEAGDVNPAVVMEIKELWNATEGCCGWYMIGAEAFQVFIDRGIKNNKPGFRELFSRFGSRYSKTTPNNPVEKLAFYKKLIADVVTENIDDKSEVSAIVKQCLSLDKETGKIAGLRRLESILILRNKQSA